MSSVAAALKPAPHNQPVNTGLGKAYCKTMSNSLSDILTGTYHLLVKSHLYHWNVVGPLFKPLHELIEDHYQTLFEAADVIAERIRALGHLAEMSRIAPKFSADSMPSANGMVKDLIADHEEAARQIREAAASADDAKDFVTNDMLTARLNFHEKALWMLRATLS